MTVGTEVTILRFLITFVLAFIFGIVRQKSHKPVGFGTFVFVAIGSCALSITAINISPETPLSLLGAIVTGIGFLGAGALIKTTDKIFGFTSAAAIWLFAIFGLVIGVGEYLLGATIYALAWIVVLYDLDLERRGIGSYQKRITIITNRMIGEKETGEILHKHSKKHKLIVLDVNKKEGKLTLKYLVEGTKEDINDIPKKLFQKEWFESCKIE
jgi:putative Mg2+ transporter-C (MgtC) family protein